MLVSDVRKELQNLLAMHPDAGGWEFIIAVKFTQEGFTPITVGSVDHDAEELFLNGAGLGPIIGRKEERTTVNSLLHALGDNAALPNREVFYRDRAVALPNGGFVSSNKPVNLFGSIPPARVVWVASVSDEENQQILSWANG